MAKKKLIVLDLLDSTEFISDRRNGVTKQTRTYKLGEEKFQIRYENSNGSCMGFNSDMCLSQYDKNNAGWNNLEDISVLTISMKIPSYYAMEDSKKHAEEFFKKMEERLVKIYS